MSSAHVLSALALAIWPIAAQAEGEISRADCQGVLDSFRDPGAVSSALNIPIRAWIDDGWCVVQGLTYEVSGTPGPGFRINRLRWRGEEMSSIANGEAPLSLQIRIDGIRILPPAGLATTGDMARAWARAATSAFDAALSIRRDPEARTVTLEDLTLDFPGENAIVVSAAVERADLSSPAAAQVSLVSMGLTDLYLAVESDGGLDSYLLMALGPLLPDGADDPGERIDALRGEATSALATVPATLFPAASREALRRFLDDLPNPRGTALLHLTAPDGIGASRFLRFAVTAAPRSAADIATVLDGASAEFSYGK
jgi:hypothetical protein